MRLAAEMIADRRYAVLGLGASGRSALARLLEAGADAVGWDDDAETRAAASRRFGVAAIVAGRERAPCPEIDRLVVSPGVPLFWPHPHPWVAAARRAGVEIVNDVGLWNEARLLSDRRRGVRSTIVGVTGSNGKSTVTALIDCILRHCGMASVAVGNIGVPPNDLDDDENAKRRIYALELSSFQLELSPAVADIGVLLNIAPDHLDRYPDMDAYAAAKANLFGAEGEGCETAIVGVGDRRCRALADRLERRRGVCVHRLDAATLGDWPLPAPPPSLPGRHNAVNYAAAALACSHLGASSSDIAAAARAFPGLPHRLRPAGRCGSVTFIDDSKATNLDATLVALQSFPDLHWIAGGRAKTDRFDIPDAALKSVRRGYFYGEAASALAQAIGSRIPCVRLSAFDDAVAAAARDALAAAPAERVVLLSPACSSFDQFADFRARGRRFERIAAAFASPPPRNAP